MSVQIRLATIFNRDAICALHVASWQANYGAELPRTVLYGDLPDEMTAKWAARSFQWPELILVAELTEDTDRLAGFVCALADRDPPLVDNLHVRPNLQSRGMGERLLRGAFDQLARKGFKRATLEVLEGNVRARAFYTRMGGRDTGRYVGDLMGQQVAERHIEFELGRI